MKLLTAHSEYIEFKPVKKALDDVEEVPKKKERIDECLVVFTGSEEKDEKNVSQVAEKASEEIKDIADKVGAKKVVLYPWVHLTGNPSSPKTAERSIEEIEKELSDSDLEVHKSPFGYYKQFEVKVKGHPLAELSREISPEEKETEETESEALKAEEEAESEFYVLKTDGSLVSADEFDFSGHEELKKFYEYETEGSRESSEEPAHTKLMQEHELVDYEPGSDPGNLRWYPKGKMIKNLLEKQLTEQVKDYGAMEVETPLMYSKDHEELKKYINRFPARRYDVFSGEDEYFLRFAACFGQYLMSRDMVTSYKNMPVKLFEMAESFRREQKGELSGLRRLRAFTMPDMHTLARDEEEAKQEFLEQFRMSLEWLESLDLDAEMGLRFVKSFYEQNKDFAKELAETIDKPILVEMWDKRFFYFSTKFELNVVDSTDKAAALSTVQIDVENSKRFGIEYTDDKGDKKTPLLLHASISGGIDRNLFALLEHQAKKEKPEWPLWLAPTQLRVVPVSDEFLKDAERLADEIPFRVDVDDRQESVSKKIRKAEKEWVPYTIVFGSDEKSSGELSVRVRGKGQEKMNLEQLIQELEEKTEDKPDEPLPLPELLSNRPKFRG